MPVGFGFAFGLCSGGDVEERRSPDRKAKTKNPNGLIYLTGVCCEWGRKNAGTLVGSSRKIAPPWEAPRSVLEEQTGASINFQAAFQHQHNHFTRFSLFQRRTDKMADKGTSLLFPSLPPNSHPPEQTPAEIAADKAREQAEQDALPYKWTQTIGDADVTFSVPGNLKSRDLVVDIKKTSISAGIKGQEPIIKAPPPVPPPSAL